jgi:glycosyltransferase involved in cell wall biosynthesis
VDEEKLNLVYGPADDSGPSFHHIKIPTNYLNTKGLCNAAWGWQPELMDKADIIVIQRQIAPESLNFVREKKRQGKTVIYTLGDNMFCLPPHSPVFYYYTPQVIKKAAQIMKECHAITTTTPYLAEQLQRNSGQKYVYVLPHLIAKEHISKIAPDKPTDEIRIGWTTTPYHIGDWPICSHAIKDICNKYPQVKIVFWGFINEDMSSYVPKEQLEFYSWVDVLEYYNCLTAMDFDIGIAPLEDTPYNNSKSPLKFIEYGMLGIPGVYSPTPPYDTVEHLETGLKPKKNRYREWYRWLEYLIENPDERVRIGMNARNHVLEHNEGYKMIDRYWEVYKTVHERVRKGWQAVNLENAQ